MTDEKRSRFRRYTSYFTEGFLKGLGSAVGATVGFIFFSSIAVYILNILGGLPVIGEWIANVVLVTQQALHAR